MIKLSYFERFIRRPLRGLGTFWFAFPQARLPSPGAITLPASFAGWLNDFFQQFTWLRPWPGCAISANSVGCTEKKRSNQKYSCRSWLKFAFVVRSCQRYFLVLSTSFARTREYEKF